MTGDWLVTSLTDDDSSAMSVEVTESLEGGGVFTVWALARS